MELSTNSIDKAIQELDRYEKELDRKNALFVQRLAESGIAIIDNTMNSVVEDGVDTSHVVSIKNTSLKDFAEASIILEGRDIYFIEFSAGITYGRFNYPLDSGNNYGVGTYPNQKYALDPNGWWYTDENGMKQHSYGNRAYMPMYKSSVEIRNRVNEIARQVYGA